MLFDVSGFKSEGYAINCTTREKSREFLSYCENVGIQWYRGGNAKSVDSFTVYGEATCYSYVNDDEGEGLLCTNKDFYLSNGYKVHECRL